MCVRVGLLLAQFGFGPQPGICFMAVNYPGRGGQTEVTPDQTIFERSHVNLVIWFAIYAMRGTQMFWSGFGWPRSGNSTR